MAVFSRDLEERARDLRGQFSIEAVIKIALDCDLFSTIEPGETDKLARRNYALQLFYEMGLIQDDIIPAVIDNWVKMDYRVKEEVDA